MERDNFYFRKNIPTQFKNNMRQKAAANSQQKAVQKNLSTPLEETALRPVGNKLFPVKSHIWKNTSKNFRKLLIKKDLLAAAKSSRYKNDKERQKSNADDLRRHGMPSENNLVAFETYKQRANCSDPSQKTFFYKTLSRDTRKSTRASSPLSHNLTCCNPNSGQTTATS